MTTEKNHFDFNYCKNAKSTVICQLFYVAWKLKLLVLHASVFWINQFAEYKNVIYLSQTIISEFLFIQIHKPIRSPLQSERPSTKFTGIKCKSKEYIVKTKTLENRISRIETNESRIIFWGNWGSSENRLELKT